MSHPPTERGDAPNDTPRSDAPKNPAAPGADRPRPADGSPETAPGQHAAPRPTPPAGPASSPKDRLAHEGVPRDGEHGPTPARPAPAQGPPPGQQPAPAGPAPAEPAPAMPELPKRPGLGRRLIGALLGFVLTPVALTLVGIGAARLADIAGTSDMGTDLLGGTLLTIGVLMLAVIVLLGIWTTSVPIIGGLVWGVVLGLAYLIVPGAMEDGAEAMTTDRRVPEAIEQVADAGMSGYLVVLGVLLVAAGLATKLARTSGRRFAERTAQVERARAEIERRRAESERRHPSPPETR